MSTTLLSHHAVWQRDKLLSFHGTAAPGAAIALSFRDKTHTATADSRGRWGLCVGPFTHGGPDDATLTIGDVATTFTDILVGDVWVCSGQSNMGMALKSCEGGEQAIASAGHPMLRLFTVPRTVADDAMSSPLHRVTHTTALPDGDYTWQRTTPQTAAGFSALAYWFGLNLTQSLNIPVGLIHASVGGTPAESWTPRYVIDSHPLLRPIIARWQQSLAAFPDPEKKYEHAFTQWDHDADLAEREGRPIPGAHPKLIGPGHIWTPTGLFNGMIAPLTSTPVKGIIWYQGTGAPERAFQYRTIFPLLICAWRWAFRDHSLPFIYGQEAEFGPKRDHPCEHSWAELREAQAMACTDINTAMAVALGTGEAADIHPKRKRPLADRFTLAARATVYGENIPYTGPVFHSMTIHGRELRLHFTHTHGGLRTSDNQPPRGFAISPGCDDFSKGHRNFVWATARIEGDDVILRAPTISTPVAARHAWAQNPDSNLTDATGLPAAPFRTDSWPGVTVNNF